MVKIHCIKNNKIFLKCYLGNYKDAQHLEAFSAVTKDWSSVLSIQVRTLQLTINLSLGIQHHLLAFLGNHIDMYI